MPITTQGKDTLSEQGRALRSQAAPGSFDVHAGGQLRMGAAGDQLELLELEDARIPASSGPALTSPALLELVMTTEEPRLKLPAFFTEARTGARVHVSAAAVRIERETSTSNPHIPARRWYITARPSDPIAYAEKKVSAGEWITTEGDPS